MIRMVLFLTVILTFAASASAVEIYLNNVVGRDSDDGSIPEAMQGRSGPVRTLSRASQLAQFGDTIILENTGTPYYGSLSLTGERHSGTANRPFVVIGNGATISGLRSVPSEGWRKERPQIWKLTATRKGYYQLIRNGQLLPEYIPEAGINPLETLPPGQWVSWRGSLYFRQDGFELPNTQDFALTADQTGISLHHVQNVLITDLTLQHFRFDGFHAQGLCENVELRNVNSVENGRGGIASTGASTVKVFGGTVARNGRHQILVMDFSTVKSHDADIQE